MYLLKTGEKRRTRVAAEEEEEQAEQICSII